MFVKQDSYSAGGLCDGGNILSSFWQHLAAVVDWWNIQLLFSK
jgi:hypothetical protein